MACERPEILVLQLDPEAPPGLIATVADRAGLRLTVRDREVVRSAPDELASARGLIVLGSAAAAVEPDEGILAALGERARADRPVLAVGTGVQLLALALGGALQPGGSHEFGYVDLVPTPPAAADPVLRGLGAGLPVMEWHDEGIALPEAVEVLAHCVRWRVQAFRHGRTVYGLRFHPGATIEVVRRWAALRGVAANNPAVPVRIGAEIVRHQERAERFGSSVVEGWLGLVRARNEATSSGTSLERS
ncbi:MAG: type 1 glutamine amidotransferase [Geminicoccaceae bacterium]